MAPHDDLDDVVIALEREEEEEVTVMMGNIRLIRALLPAWHHDSWERSSQRMMLKEVRCFVYHLMVCLSDSEDSDPPPLQFGGTRQREGGHPDSLARLILYGQFQKEGVCKVDEFLKFSSAFGEECAMYVGGPNMKGSPAILLHGIEDLPGAMELSSGLKIYR